MKLNSHKTVAEQLDTLPLKEVDNFFHPFIKSMIWSYFSKWFEYDGSHTIDTFKVEYNIVHTYMSDCKKSTSLRDGKITLALEISLLCMRVGLIIGRKGHEINELNSYLKEQLDLISKESKVYDEIELKVNLVENRQWSSMYDYEIYDEETYQSIHGKYEINS